LVGGWFPDIIASRQTFHETPPLELGASLQGNPILILHRAQYSILDPGQVLDAQIVALFAC
jgi:hypothetical protein